MLFSYCTINTPIAMRMISEEKLIKHIELRIQALEEDKNYGYNSIPFISRQMELLSLMQSIIADRMWTDMKDYKPEFRKKWLESHSRIHKPK